MFRTIIDDESYGAQDKGEIFDNCLLYIAAVVARSINNQLRNNNVNNGTMCIAFAAKIHTVPGRAHVRIDGCPICIRRGVTRAHNVRE